MNWRDKIPASIPWSNFVACPSKGRNFSRRVTATGLVLVSLLLIASVAVSSGQKNQKLEKHYREWLDRDVTYIITKDEREAFLRLATDEARDKFIEEFWEIRNPNPGTPSNPYKDEIYRRIAFVNARFGTGSGAQGWRSDRGRTYITLGEPQQKQTIQSGANLRPIEIWFYSNADPSLPPFFYVMFYQREYTGEYRFYSPYTDGPEKLVTPMEAINSPTRALKMIQDSAGPEVARISLSLLPDEPVDLVNATASLQSDILLSTIKSLANSGFNREEIEKRHSLHGNVTARMLLEGHNLDIVTLAARDSRGQTRLDYAIRLGSPSELAVTPTDDGRFTFALEVRVQIFGPDNRLIFTQQKNVADSFDKRTFLEVKEKVFGYEGTLPLPPGKYRLDFQFTDWGRKVAYRTQREVMIPQPDKLGIVIPSVLVFTTAEAVDPAIADVTPFAMGGVKFTPAPASTPVVDRDNGLQVVYQIWAPPKDPRTYLGQHLNVDYALGRPASVGSTATVQDQVGMEQFDPAGSLVSGKKLSLSEKSAGNYILTVSATNPNANMHGFATINFKILADAPVRLPWDVREPAIEGDAASGRLDEERGLCYLSQGQPDQARIWLRHALQLGHGNDTSRARLVDVYFARKDYAAVVSLYEDAGVTDSTDSQTLLRIASSLDAIGKPRDGISLLENALRAHPQDGPLYFSLARLYGAVGDSRKAAELSQKGKSLH